MVVVNCRCLLCVTFVQTRLKFKSTEHKTSKLVGRQRSEKFRSKNTRAKHSWTLDTAQWWTDTESTEHTSEGRITKRRWKLMRQWKVKLPCVNHCDTVLMKTLVTDIYPGQDIWEPLYSNHWFLKIELIVSPVRKISKRQFTEVFQYTRTGS